MKNTKRCSECGGTNIRATEVSAGGGHAPDLLPGAHPWWRSGKLEIYVCMVCGYFQYFVPQEGLREIEASNKFERV